MAGIRIVITDEQGRICLVRHGYGAHDWNVPGGGIDQGESLLDAAVREVQEETGILARVDGLVGLYSIPGTRDLVAWLRGCMIDEASWSPDQEIVEVAFVSPDDLPEPMHPCIRRCIQDAVSGATGLVCVLDHEGSIVAGLGT